MAEALLKLSGGATQVCSAGHKAQQEVNEQAVKVIADVLAGSSTGLDFLLLDAHRIFIRCYLASRIESAYTWPSVFRRSLLLRRI